MEQGYETGSGRNLGALTLRGSAPVRQWRQNPPLDSVLMRRCTSYLEPSLRLGLMSDGLPFMVRMTPNHTVPRTGSYSVNTWLLHTAVQGWVHPEPLPGAVNVSFFDGHGELIKLDCLWQLYWHKDYRPPAKRTGLQ